MTIYVDDLVFWKHTGRSWCHMASDLEGDAGLTELHAIAADMGMKRSWFQPRGSLPHYDVQPRLRVLAISLGAVPVDSVELVRRCSTLPLFRKRTESA